MSTESKLSYLDYVLSGNNVEQAKNIVVAVDISGAFLQQNVDFFIKQIQEEAKNYVDLNVILLYSDTDVHYNNVTTIDKPLERFIIGSGGGTDFRGVFRWIDENLEYCDGLIYYTDGYGAYPEKEPDYKCMWVLTSDYDVPFGKKF